MAKLECYRILIIKWQGTINLVGARSLSDIWRRHFLDSAQLIDQIPDAAHRVVDLGSGGGFPGLVLAILGAPEVVLIESDARKASFLREAARLIDAPATILTGRIEQITPLKADVVTARACAPLKKLIDYAERHRSPGGFGLFLKGKRVDEELTEARKHWNMRFEKFSSRSDPSGTILKVEVVSREPS